MYVKIISARMEHCAYRLKILIAILVAAETVISLDLNFKS
jgi:hypothetical protein